MSEETPSEPDQGIQLDLISSERGKNMPINEKLKMILDRVSEDAVIILEGGLTPDEESKLIERTMQRTDGDEFTGIEIESYPADSKDDSGLLGRLVQRDSSSKLTIIGPANKVHTLDKNEELLRTFVSDD